ncbi:MAG: 50S ribosomal protein L6, partial [Verrucomicrobia bacterium]|nr:50S ribosomal protein L6 [Verrucomicrobiota bacterium]
RDVNPAMTKMGCNQGSCHGAKDGKAGFKLSLRGYDPEYDIRSLTDDLASRRVVTSSPDDSLMLLKAVAEVPHEGGRKTRTDEKYYQILREWIASGASLKSNSPRVIGIELSPSNPVVQAIGSQQQFRVTARYADGSLRDVTNEAFIESGNTDVASVDPSALVTTIRRGEAPLLARFEGNYVATTLTVMGDRSGFRWNEPITWNRIDNLVAAKWKRMQIEPSDLAADNEFLRRVTLDLTGMPPTAEKLRAFLADPTESRKKRDAVIDELIGSPDFIEHWTNKWSDLLQVNTKFLANEGAVKFRSWIRQQIEQNTPYDQFVRTILTATGSNKDAPAASYWKILRQPTEAMENTTHLFLATRFNCNKCHDHPFERWTQDQYYETAAYFAQFTLAPDPASGGKNIPGTAVESAKALYEIVKDNPGGEVKHDRTGKITAPQFPYPAKAESKPESSRREKLADWVTSPDNRYFASSYVNRIWGYLLGRGIIEPLDDIRAGNPPSNPELLEHLTQEFLKSNFNTREVFRMICKSRTYQLSIKTNRWNNDDEVNYSHAIARRLPAEVLFDSVFKVTGAKADLPGVGAGGRAALMVDSSSQGPAGFLATLGKPARESTCECERSSNLGLGSVMAFLSGPVVSSAIQDPKNQLTELVSKQPEDTQLIQELFQRVLSRDASTTEIEATQKIFASIDADSQNIQEAWAAKEKEQAPIIAKMEMDRQNAIAAAKGKGVTLNLGHSHSIDFDAPAGIEIKVDKQTSIIVSGADKELVGRVSATLRGLRAPEPYHGKGVRYADEVIATKVGKAAG